MAERDPAYLSRLQELREKHGRLFDEWRLVGDELHQLAAPRGDEPHHHGEGTYADPSRSHSHPYTDEDHEHSPRSAEDAPWPEGD